MSITNAEQKGVDVAAPLGIATQDYYKANSGKTTTGNALALTDGFGDIVSYRSTMTEENKDTLLEKNNNFDEIVGAMLGNIHDKVAGQSQNKDLIDQLIRDYDVVKGDPKAAKSYVFVGTNTNSERLAQYYAMIPKASRDVLPVYEVNGRVEKGVWVHKSDLNLVFGQRSMSIQNLFTVPAEHRNHVNKFLVALFEGVLGKKAAAKLTKAENIWREIVKMGKDNLVVKSLIITGANYVSNYVTLVIAGMNPIDAINYQYEAIEQGKKYQEWATQSYKLGLDIEVNKRNPAMVKRLKARKAAVDSRMTSSPIHDLVRAGGLQTIVEDLPSHTQADQYSYKTKGIKKLSNATDRLTGGLNENVVAVGKEVLMTQDSTLYSVANNSVQLSDFAARYAMSKHLTEGGMSAKEAFRDSMDIFIMYDLPTNRFIQYGNDIGVLWFTKYLLRNQRAFWYMAQKHAFRTLLFSGINGVTSTDIASLYDAPLTPQGLDNRFAGVFDILSTFDNLAPIAAGKNIMQELF
jgi:hypothetical protein